MRLILSDIFKNEIVAIIQKKQKFKIGVIGGSMNEPEILGLNDLGIEYEIYTLGIENTEIFLDLNEELDLKIGTFDLVLCSQVLEHIWNHQNAFNLFFQLLKPDGFIWITCPASNRKHASPQFYSAGFSGEYLEKNLRKFNFYVTAYGDFGSKREYLSRHLLPTWFSFAAHRRPLFSAFDDRKLIKRLVLRAIYLFPLIYCTFSSAKVRYGTRWSTESFAFAQKNIN